MTSDLWPLLSVNFDFVLQNESKGEKSTEKKTNNSNQKVIYE